MEEMEKREKKERDFLNYFQNIRVLFVIYKHLPRIVALGILGSYCFLDNLVEMFILLLRRCWKSILSM